MIGERQVKASGNFPGNGCFCLIVMRTGVNILPNLKILFYSTI